MTCEEWKYCQRWEMQQVHPRIYIGPYSAAKDSSTLIANQINHILCIRDQLEESFIKPFHPTEFIYQVIEAKNSPFENLIPLFEPVSSYIDSVLADERNRILIHCIGGISRAPTFVIAYLMGKGNTFQKSYTLVQDQRFCINPCETFLGQLKVISFDEGYETIVMARHQMRNTLSLSRDKRDLECEEGTVSPIID